MRSLEGTFVCDVLTGTSIRGVIKTHSIRFLIRHVDAKSQMCLDFQSENRNDLDKCHFRDCGSSRLLVQQRHLSVAAGRENPT